MTKLKPLNSKDRYLRLARQFLMVITISLLSFSCRDKIEVFSIQRLGVFSFSPDDFVTQFANDVKFYQGKQILYYYDENTSQLYTRYLLEARGTNPGGGRVIISIETDFITTNSYIGIYRPQYEVNRGGIHSFNLLNEGSNGVYKSYNMDPDLLEDTYLQVERQNIEEKLILGDFVAKLRNDLDPTDKITLYQGTFKDISYAN